MSRRSSPAARGTAALQTCGKEVRATCHSSTCVNPVRQTWLRTAQEHAPTHTCHQAVHAHGNYHIASNCNNQLPEAPSQAAPVTRQ